MPSPKISAKSLSYSSDLPPFLRALHAQSGAGGSSGGPDPILAGRRRAAKKRSDSEEAEDQPLVVDEQGNVVQLNPDGSAPSAGDDAATADGKATPADEDGEPRTKEKLAGIGAGRKRKVGRVVGDEGSDTAKDKHESEAIPDGETKSKPADGNKPKKKKAAKKIKLSFDAE